MDRPRLEVIEGERGRQERASLREQYRRYGGQVHGRCRYLLGDTAEAEDAVQEVFARALVHREAIRGDGAVLAWLLQSATHHCVNVIRANRTLWKDEAKKVALISPTAIDDGVGRALVRSLLSRFDVETQRCAVHYLVDEMSQEEVAQVVGLSVPTVRKRVRPFLAAARAALGLPEEETP